MLSSTSDLTSIRSNPVKASIEQLSFVASCPQLVNTALAMGCSITIEQVCQGLGIDWYQPRKLTRGLMVEYLCALIEGRAFSATTPQDTYSPDIQQTLDKAA